MLMRSWALRASQTAICQIKIKKSKVGVFGILYRTDYCQHEPEVPIVPQSIEFFLQIADLGRVQHDFHSKPGAGSEGV